MIEQEIKQLNLRLIRDTLETLARIHSQGNKTYEFDLEKDPKEIFKNELVNKNTYVGDSHYIKKVDMKNAFTMFFKLFHDKWFYKYERKNEILLPDFEGHFSRYNNPSNKEWIKKFIDFLFKTLNPIMLYEIEYGYLNENFSPNIDYDMFIFECEDGLYQLKLSLTH